MEKVTYQKTGTAIVAWLTSDYKFGHNGPEFYSVSSKEAEQMITGRTPAGWEKSHDVC